MKDLVSVLNVTAVLILVNCQLGLDGRPSDVEVILFGQLLDVHVDSGVAEVVGFVAGFVLGLVVPDIVADHYVALLVYLGLDTASIAWRNETEWKIEYLFLNSEV